MYHLLWGAETYIYIDRCELVIFFLFQKIQSIERNKNSFVHSWALIEILDDIFQGKSTALHLWRLVFS